MNLLWIKQKRKLFWTLQLSGWAAFGLSMFLATAPWLPLKQAAFEKTIFTVLGLCFSLPLRAIYRRLYRDGWSLPRIILVSAACAYAASVAWTICFHLTLGVVRGRSMREWSALLDGALYHAFVMLSWSVLYFAVKYYADLQAQTEQRLKAESLAARAQLDALRYQLNPHFLFNTLNAISTLIVQNETAAANRMIARLADFLRLSLEDGGSAEVPLASELEFVNRYLEIERVRFGDRLEIRYEIEAETLSIPVPNLILQPLVENAIRHAIAPRETGGRLEIEAKRTGDLLCLEVRDDGPELNGKWSIGASGVGLSNTRARLNELYGPAHRFELRLVEGGGCAVSIGVPLRKKPEALP
jgi:two-component system LytT family sensor kinase